MLQEFRLQILEVDDDLLKKLFVISSHPSHGLRTFTAFEKKSVFNKLKTMVMNFEFGTKVFVLNEHHDFAAFKLSM